MLQLRARLLPDRMHAKAKPIGGQGHSLPWGPSNSPRSDGIATAHQGASRPTIPQSANSSQCTACWQEPASANAQLAGWRHNDGGMWLVPAQAADLPLLTGASRLHGSAGKLVAQGWGHHGLHPLHLLSRTGSLPRPEALHPTCAQLSSEVQGSYETPSPLERAADDGTHAGQKGSGKLALQPAALAGKGARHLAHVAGNVIGGGERVFVAVEISARGRKLVSSSTRNLGMAYRLGGSPDSLLHRLGRGHVAHGAGPVAAPPSEGGQGIGDVLLVQHILDGHDQAMAPNVQPPLIHPCAEGAAASVREVTAVDCGLMVVQGGMMRREGARAASRSAVLLQGWR